jgi:NADPH:quinone reductase-like Zn-dependent oxidoreductase
LRFVALQFLSRANIESGQQVLVYGASGANGTCAIQLAKCFGAEVTAVCSTANVELLRFLGADTVLDYTKEPASALRRYDEAGTLKPVIDRRYPLERIADAHRYVEQGHKKGNVVITIAD